MTTDTIRLWQHIYGDGIGYIYIWSAVRPEAGSKPLSQPHEQFYPYPIAAENAATWLEGEAARGREVYFGTHLYTERERPKEDAKRYAAPVSTLWIDGDGAKVPATLPQPTATVDSSPNKQHYYLRLTRAIEPARAEELNKRYAYAIGADKGGWGLTKILRPPNTPNRKYPDAPIVQLVHLDDNVAYDPDELDRILPPLPETPKRERDAGEGDGTAPVVLDAYGQETWRGEHPKTRDGGILDRSGSLLKIARVLYDAGATRPTIVAALRERDAALEWNKYTGRADGEQRYQGAVDELEKTGRNPQYRATIGQHGVDDAPYSDRIAELEAKNARYLETIKTLQRERDEAQAALTLQWAVIRNRFIKGQEKLVALAVIHRVAEANAHEGTEDGYVHITIGGAAPDPKADPCRDCGELSWVKAESGQWVCGSCGTFLSKPTTGSLADVCGASRQRVSANLDRLQEWRFLEKRVTRNAELDPETGDLRWSMDTKIRLTAPPLVTLKRLADFRPDVASTWGGKREHRCPDHPDAPTITVTKCAVCNRVLHQTMPRAVAEAPEDDLEQMLQDVTSEDSTSSVDRSSSAPSCNICPPDPASREPLQMIQDVTSAPTSPRCTECGGPTAIGRAVCLLCQAAEIAAVGGP
jgi:hypothetical protein